MHAILNKCAACASTLITQRHFPKEEQHQGQTETKKETYAESLTPVCACCVCHVTVVLHHDDWAIIAVMVMVYTPEYLTTAQPGISLAVKPGPLGFYPRVAIRGCNPFGRHCSVQAGLLRIFLPGSKRVPWLPGKMAHEGPRGDSNPGLSHDDAQRELRRWSLISIENRCMICRGFSLWRSTVSPNSSHLGQITI